MSKETADNSISITGHTSLYGLLGSPVAHSISPMMHNESFMYHNIDSVYLCFDVDTDNLSAAVDGLKKAGIKGFNCTMPNKNLILSLVDEISPAAEIIGAANTIINDGGRLIAHNTDGTGYMMACKDAGHNIIGKKMTLLGAGGAASAILTQAALDGVKVINVFSIKDKFWERAEKMIDSINSKTECHASLFELGDDAILADSLAESDILTNATSVGMVPNTDACIINDISMLHSGLIVSDIIYNPFETKLYQMAKNAGCPVFNGLYMLLYQGAEAFRIWTGKEMPVNIIKEKYFNK